MKKCFSHIIFLLTAVYFAVPSTNIFAENKDEWKKHESLTNRLGSEWYRVGILQNDLDDIKDLLSDLVDFEIYPQSVTKLSDENIVQIDREIEKVEKLRSLLQSELDKIKTPLSDDIEILREMAAGDVVENMFDVLIEGDMMRISELISIKHKIDDLRKESENILTKISSLMKISVSVEEEKFSEESDFLEIIRANLGLYSEIFYQKVNNVKNQLAKRALDKDLQKMYNVEIYQIKKVISEKGYRISDRKLSFMIDRYGKKINTDEIYTLIALSKFGLGNYLEALNNAQYIKDKGKFINQKDLINVQSWYALQMYENIDNWKLNTDLFRFSPKERNLLLWIIIESGMKQNPDIDYSKSIELVDADSPYSIHVLHAIARSYFLREQPEVSLSILEKVTTRDIPADPLELKAYEKAKSTKAKILFEMGDYRNALEEFFSLINSQDFFEEALFGMSWCYIKLNSYAKAEATLKKLINQSPESTESAEAMLTMAKRFINKAQHEWSKIQYISKEEKRILTALTKLNNIKKNSKDEIKVNQAIQAEKELLPLYKSLNSEKRLTPKEIDRFYKQAIKISDIVIKNYETGSFKEFTFSEQREKILYKLDSLTLSIEGKKKINENGTFRKNILQIKSVVKKSDIVKTEFLIDQYRWKVEFIDWLKKNIRDTISSIVITDNIQDSTSNKNALLKKSKYLQRIDSLINVQNLLFENHYNEIVVRSIALLKTDLNPENESYIRYNLGELFYKKENQIFAQEFNLYEKELARYDSLYNLYNDGKIDTLPLEPPRPKLSHKKSIEQYKTSIQKFSSDTLISAHRYSLAWCYNDLMMTDSAVKHMTIVAEKHKTSQYAPQAWMYLGEFYFDNAKLDQAVESYKNVMRYPESRWFDNALYKLAWTQYRLSNPEKAISSFLALVDLGKGIKGGKSLLENESIDYIAISFSESDISGEKGLQRAKLFCRKLNDPEKGTKILHRLASVYEEQGRFKMAIKSYKTLLSMYPDYQNNPKVESDLITVMSRDIPLEESNELKMQYFMKYNRKSDWAKKQTDKSIITLADSTASKQLYDASVAYHRIALEKNDSNQYNKALDAYRLFIHNYPKAQKTNECHYNLAEILFSTGQYHKAAEEYIAVSKRYPDSKYRETAAWNAIVASQTLLQLEKESIK